MAFFEGSNLSKSILNSKFKRDGTLPDDNLGPSYDNSQVYTYGDTYSSEYYYYDEHYTPLTISNYSSYQVLSFERSVYLYLWTILIILTTLANILVMLVLMRRNMRTSTNLNLCIIAISDTLTGLSTLPTTIYGFTHQENNYLILTREWCEAFQISKFYVSRTFHTVSIWLTVILAFQRLVSVTFPFKAQSMFTIPKTLIIIAIVCVLTPFLHIYHVLRDHHVNGICMWTMKEPCEEGCFYLWLVFYFMHFTPCLLLVVFTIVMVAMLLNSSRRSRLSSIISNKENIQRRNYESRRISLIVVVVVVVFLIPEIPYGIFTFITLVTEHTVGIDDSLSFEANRVFHCVYEISLVLSFHANFWIYLVMNRKFRRGLTKLMAPCLIPFGIEIQSSVHPTEAAVEQVTMAHTMSNTSSVMGLEMKVYQPGVGNSFKSGKMVVTPD